MITPSATPGIEFRAEPERVNWPARVAAYLDALPADPDWPPRKDLALMEAVAAGSFLALTEGYSAARLAAARQRVWLMMDAIRDDDRRPTLDGRAALLAVLRGRAAE